MRVGAGRGAMRGDLLLLFGGGSAAGLGDGQLLGRFVEARDEGAFAALVGRLAPMVWGVCRRMLRDEADAEDAFQATFLVLARRAGSIRDRDVVGTWTYQVAVRVARKARGDASRRAARERPAAIAEASQRDAGLPERAELRAEIDEAIGRLPESHRRVVVLCDVEGLGRDEAAARLGWTANMVRGRLERARARLRARLAHRGLSPSGADLTPGALLLTPKPALMDAAIRPALSFAIGRWAASAPAVILSEGVIRMMVLSKWKFAASALLTAGAMAAGSGWLAAQPGPGDGVAAPKSATTIPPPSVQAAGPAEVGSIAALSAARVEAARARYQAQKESFGEGRITIDRLIDASRGLMAAEGDASRTVEGQIDALRDHHRRLVELLKGEEDELAVGRATRADVSEVKSALAEAEFAWKRLAASPDDGKPRAADGPKPEPGSLAGAVAEFNDRFLNSAKGRAEPALTEDEVVAAVRFWRPDRETTVFLNGVPSHLTPAGAPIETFKAIAESRRMPSGTRFEGADVLDLGEDVAYLGCWIRLEVPAADGRHHAFPIRSRLFRVLSLEELLERDETIIQGRADKLVFLDPYGPRANPAERAKNLKERIEWRDKKAGK